MSSVDLIFNLIGKDKTAPAFKSAGDSMARLGKTADAAGRSTSRAGDDADKAGGRMRRAFAGVDSGLDRVGKAALTAGAALGGIAIAGAVGGIVKAASAASDLGESINAVNVTFGEAADGINQLGTESAKALGMSRTEFNQLAVQFSNFAATVAGPGGDVAKTMDELTTRASDFASVMNLDVAEAATLFQSGLAGETEPLRKYGLDLSAAAVEAYALANGIGDGTGELTEQEKVLARYGILMESTSKTAGDFANTQGSMANQSKLLRANLENFAATVGTAFTPLAEAVMPRMNEVLVDMTDTLSANMPAISESMRQFGEQAGAALADLADRWPEIKDGLTDFAAALRDEWPNIQAAAENLGAALERVSAFAGALYQAWTSLPPEAQKALALLAIAQRTGVLTLAFKGFDAIKGLVSHINAATVYVAGNIVGDFAIDGDNPTAAGTKMGNGFKAVAMSAVAWASIGAAAGLAWQLAIDELRKYPAPEKTPSPARPGSTVGDRANVAAATSAGGSPGSAGTGMWMAAWLEESGFTKSLETAKRLVSGTWTQITADTQQGMINFGMSVGTGLHNVGTNIVTWQAGVEQNIQGWLDGLGPAFETGWALVGTVTSNAWSGITTGIKQSWDENVATISGGLSQVSATVGAAWGVVQVATSQAWGAITQAISSAWASISGAVSSGAAQVWGLIGAAWAVVQVATSQAWGSVTQAISNAWAAITGAVSGAVSRVAGLVSAAWSMVQVATSQAWSAVTAAIGNAWAAISGVVSGALAAVSGAISGAWSAVQGATASAWGNVRDTVTRLMGDARDRVSDALERIKGLFSGAVDAIGGIWSRVSGVVKEPIASMFNWINDNMIAPINTVLGKFSDSLRLGELPRFHSGGYTGDAIGGPEGLAVLRNDEFVVGPKATRENRGLLEAINAGRLGFGIGGPFDVLGSLVDSVESLVAKGAGAAIDTIGTPLMETLKGRYGGKWSPSLVYAGMDNVIKTVKGWSAKRDAEQAALSVAAGGGFIGPSSGILGKPLNPYVVTSEFGPRWGTMHAGIDLGAPGGQPIYAAAAGKVMQAGWNDGYGIYAAIDHGGGLWTTYGHMSGLASAAGQILAAGQTVGFVGTTGDSTGNHLHFETRVGGQAVNPRQFVAFDSGGMLQPGWSTVYNGTGSPEPVLTDKQWKQLNDSGRPIEVRVYLDGRELHESHVRYRREAGLA